MRQLLQKHLESRPMRCLLSVSEKVMSNKYESYGLAYFSTLYSPLVTFLQIKSTNSLLYRLFPHLREVSK